MTSKLKQIVKQELSGWQVWEVTWLVIACAVILGLSIYWKDTAIGIISATTGVACVVCTGKGKLSAYLFGIINVVLYAYISYQAKFYGEVMLNLIYYFPMQFYGFYVWSKHMNPESNEVEKKLMSVQGRILLCAVTAVATVGYGFILKILGGTLPFVDAFSTVASVVAMIISIKMYAEQWVVWIVVNVVSVIMWAIAFAQSADSMATLLMWIVYLFNAIVMFVKWMKEARKNAV